MSREQLGLPSNIRACLFDLDGVITDTAALHAEAWKRTFDEYLRRRPASTGAPFVPFDRVRDNERYVDGRPRDEGTRSFLASRSISLPDGRDDDPPGVDSVRSLGKRKAEILLELERERGVHAYPGSVRYLKAVKEAGLRTAVVSSSRHCRQVLSDVGLADQFDTEVDGNVVTKEHIKGKPAPDTYLRAASALDTPASDAAIYEDALAGVEAGRAGHFGCVVGVDRVGQSEQLKEHGADVVVPDLGNLLAAT
jgi:beta-phosphoglucomutase family hydrolase